jgi:hypothetical protein
MERSTGDSRKFIPARSRLLRLLGILIIAAFLLPGRGHAHGLDMRQPHGGAVAAAAVEMVTSSTNVPDADGCPMTDGHCALCPCCGSACGPIANVVPGDIAIRPAGSPARVPLRHEDPLRSLLPKSDPPVPKQIV